MSPDVKPLAIEHVSVGRKTLEFASVGSGSPVLLLPGAGGLIRMLWELGRARDFITALSQRHRVLLTEHDMRDLSESHPPEPESFLNGVVGDRIAVLDAAGVDRCHVVASLMATIPAVALASAHPDRVNSLLLWDGVLAGTAIEPASGARALTELSRAPDSNVATGAFVGANGMAADSEELEEYRQMFERYPGLPGLMRAGRIAFRAVMATDGRSRASAVQCRTLVVAPENAVLPGPGAPEELAHAIPGGLLVPVAGGATSPHLAAHSVSIPLVTDWLGRGADRERGPAEPPSAPLTRRELEVVKLVELGLSNREIADRLTLSIHTVGRHLTNLSPKLGASNRTDAARRARERGLLD